MAGIAKDYDTVALFMVNLEKTESIKSVALGSTNISEMEGQSVSNFTLTCVRDTGEAPPDKKGKGKKSRRR